MSIDTISISRMGRRSGPAASALSNRRKASTRLTLGSLDTELRKNADGSVDIYIVPKPPSGQESNWLYTPTGEQWLPWFRVYGPEKAIMDKSWKLPNIERIND
jgi:hypothetical protein